MEMMDLHNLSIEELSLIVKQATSLIDKKKEERATQLGDKLEEVWREIIKAGYYVRYEDEDNCIDLDFDNIYLDPQ